jgi:hypothetical protein
MAANGNLSGQVVLRRREPGYLRFDLPRGLGAGAAAALIRKRLEALEGVYRVSLYAAYDKLAVRFHPAVCDAARVARALAEGLGAVEAGGLAPGCEQCVREAREQERASGLKARVLELRPVRWARAKLQEMRQTATALQQLSRSRFKQVPAFLEHPERTAHEFLTDILVLYLIKVHWDRITHQWLRAPFAHRYEWLAAFYLTYLMVRSRRQAR